MAIRLEQIVSQVSEAIERDYAGMPECDDGAGARWAASLRRSLRTRTLDDRLFFRAMQERIAGLADHNLCFLCGPGAGYAPETCGFAARRCGDELYVTAAPLDGRLAPGDAVERVNRMRPAEALAQRVGNPTGSDDPERQDWSALLAESAHIEVRHADGRREELRTRRWPAPGPGAAAARNAFSRLDDGTCVLTVGELDDDGAARLLAARRQEAAAAPRLVLDLRACTGGIESMAYPFLDWLFDQDTNLNRVLEPETLLTNYTAANCDRRIAQIAQLKALAEAQGDERGALGWLDDNLAAVRANRGKGYVEEVVQPEDLPIHAAPAGQRVLVLTDTATADAAEWLASVASCAPRAVLVGRATRGGLDYSNPLAISFDDRFIFVYPMSKTKMAAEGHGMRGRGIAPDVRVPFTPEECLRDVILERALEV